MITYPPVRVHAAWKRGAIAQARTAKELASSANINKVISVVCCLSILVPFCISILYVYLFGVNVFFADEWDFVVPLRRLYRDTLSIADLFAHHNEHIYFLPYTVMLLSGTITDYNTVPLMYLVQVCIFVTSVSLFLAFRKSFEDRHSLLLIIPIPFLLFSLRQHENML